MPRQSGSEFNRVIGIESVLRVWRLFETGFDHLNFVQKGTLGVGGLQESVAWDDHEGSRRWRRRRQRPTGDRVRGSLR